MHATIEVIEKKKKQSSTFPIHAYREAMRASRGAFNDGKGAYNKSTGEIRPKFVVSARRCW
jgi:meiotically up-regulated gene 157 (Mug157) protein